MAIEGLVNHNPGTLEKSCSPDFSKNNDQSIEKILSPDFLDTKKRSDEVKVIPNYNDTSPRLQADENGCIKTRNDYLEGQNHPVTDVPFKKKTVITDTGEEVTGVFPEFDSIYDAQLPEDLLQAPDNKQFDECNKQLKAAVESDEELAKKFDDEQLEQIKNGDTPDGYVWHHNEETGKMQLVDSETHAKTGHTGGRSIWGGGSDNR